MLVQLFFKDFLLSIDQSLLYQGVHLIMQRVIETGVLYLVIFNLRSEIFLLLVLFTKEATELFLV